MIRQPLRPRYLLPWRSAVVAAAVVVLAAAAAVAAAQSGGDCYAGLVVGPGERCTYPGTSQEFWVDDSGRGHFVFFTAGTGIDARGTTINGVTYNFKASKQADGTWLIEAAGTTTTTTTTTAPTTTTTTATTTTTTTVPSTRFPDVAADHYAFEAAEWAARVGVTTGYTDGTFKPQRPLIKRHAVVFMERFYDEILQAEESEDFTRGDMMVLLKAINDGTIRGTESGTATEPPSQDAAGRRFPDVAPGHYAFEAAEWAARVGVTTGYTDGTFKPQRPLIKRHAVVFMERFYDEILQAEESEDFTRGDMMVLLKAINDGTIRGTALPGEGVDIVAGRAPWVVGYFPAELYKLLLEELGYNVSDPADIELGPHVAYIAMAQGEMDYWPNSLYPVHLAWLEGELPDGSLVGDHVTIVGEQMLDGGLQGFLVTKSFADEYGVYTMDGFNSNADALAAFDATDSNPGNGVADIFGCPESWICDNIIENMIAFSGWDNIAQTKAGYDNMFAQAVDNVGEGIPMVLFTWTPSYYITQFRPGDNVYWMGVDEILDDSNPANQEGGESHSQRGADGSGGYASIGPDQCPSAADQQDGKCKIGWEVHDILVTANNDFLAANPAAQALFEAVKLSVIDASLAMVAVRVGESPADLAAQWIAANRDLADEWIAAALSPSTADEANRPPRFTSAATLRVPENTTAVGVVAATDDDTADSVTGYAVTGGTDRSRFSITSRGRLSFNTAPDHERPTDTGRDNTYQVTVTATSGTDTRVRTATHTVTVTVTDEAEALSAPAAPTMTSSTDTTVTLTWSEPVNTALTINDYDIQYRRRGTTAWTAWPHTGTARTATITGLTANTTYDIQVRAKNPEGTSRWSATTSATTAEVETTAPGEAASGDCYVGLILRPGEMCTYPGSSQILSVDSNGKGRWSAIPFVSFSGAVDFTVGGERFAAHPQGDGTWIIDAVG